MTLFQLLDLYTHESSNKDFLWDNPSIHHDPYYSSNLLVNEYSRKPISQQVPFFISATWK